MNKRDILIICLILCFIGSLQVAFASDVDNTSIGATHDDSVVSIENVSAYTLPGSDKALQGSVNAVSFKNLETVVSGDGSDFASHNYTWDSSSDSGLTGGILISKDITLDGKGKVIIDAQNSARIFKIAEGKTVTLKGITFINAKTPNGPGGSILANGVVHIDNCSFIDNTATNGDGGAIFFNDTASMSTITNSYFEGNRAINNGKDGVGAGGAIFIRTSHTAISHSTFIENYAGLNGGAIASMASITNCTINNCTFESNAANGSAGAVGMQIHNFKMYNSTFRYNEAKGLFTGTLYYPGNGGGIVLRAGDSHVYNCTFDSNVARLNGGATFVTNTSDGTINENTGFELCTFINNTANMGSGGAIDWFTGATEGYVKNTDFTNNTAHLNGGAIYWQGHDGIIESSTFTNNLANRSGGAVYWKGTEGTILHSTFTDNSAYGRNSAPDSYGSLTCGGNGGAIMWVGSIGDIYNTTFTRNSAYGHEVDDATYGTVVEGGKGGAIYLQGGAEGDCHNTTFDNCTFDSNYAQTNGGAIDWYHGASDGHVNDSIFINNIAGRSGGAIFWSGHEGYITHCQFTNNTANGNVAGNDSYGNITLGGNGGAIRWAGYDGDVYNCTFNDNIATKHGGAVYLNGGSEGNCYNTTFDTCTFINNTADFNGGAINWQDGAHDGLIIKSEFINNVAKRNGGAIYWNGINGTIVNSTFKNNRANGTNPEYNMAVIQDGTGKNIEIITESPTSLLGSGKLYVVNTTLDDGKIAHFESWVNDNGKNKMLDEINITVSESIISPIDWAIDQYFGGDGGSILWEGDVGLIYNCTFIDSNSARRGGGAYMTGSNNVTYNLCYFENCTSGTNGGGVDWLAGANYGKIYNCIFNHTQAARSAGAIYYDGWYGDLQNITIINTRSNGGNSTFRTIKGDLITYAGWDSSHWDTNTTGGDAGAIMFTGSYIDVYNVTFTNCIANGRGGAVFLQDNHNVTFDNCKFENNYALGIANNTYFDDYDISSGLYQWNTGHGGAIAFDVRATNGTIKNSKFINNTAARNGGAIAFNVDSSYATIYNSTFDNNTARVSGGAFTWKGTHGTISYCNFTNNSALGENLFEYVNLISLDQIIGVTTLPEANASTYNNLYILIKYNETTNKNESYTMYVTVQNGDDYEWLKLKQTTETEPSYKDWGTDEWFGGDGGSILWGGDYGTIDHCIFINSNSARRGGGAYMLGSDHLEVYNSWFENCTSGTNGGGLDWLAGANYGKVINSTFKNTRAARSAGAIYYDGDGGHMENITIINATSHGGLDLFTSGDGRVTYATWDTSHWDYNTTGGDGGAIMITGVDEYLYNVTFTNCTSVGRGGAVFLQDNNNVTFDNCKFENNRALGTANNTAESKIVQNSTDKEEKLTGHGGAIAFDLHASNCTITESTFINNFARRNGGAINFDQHSDNNLIEHCEFTNNTVWDDGGAINIDHNSDWNKIDDCTFTNNTATGRNGSTSKGGTICLTGDYTVISSSTFKLCAVYANTTEGAKLNETDAGAIFITGNHVNVTDCNFTDCTAPNMAGAMKLIGNYTNIINCIIENCTAVESSGAIHISGNGANINNTSFVNCTTSGEHGGALCISGNDAVVFDSTFDKCEATYDEFINGDDVLARGGAMHITGNNATIIKSTFKNNYVTGDGAALYVQGKDCKLYNSTFTNNTAGDDGGAIYWKGSNGIIYNITCEDNKGISQGNSTSNGGTVDVEGSNITIAKSYFAQTSALIAGGAIFVTGNNVNITESTFERCNVSHDYPPESEILAGKSYVNGGGAIYVLGNYTNILNCNFKQNNGREGASLYIQGHDVTVDNAISTMTYAKNGGSIYIKGENATVSNSDISKANTTLAHGGAILVAGNNANISGSNFSYCNAAKYGGAIFVEGVNTTIEKSKFQVTNAVIDAKGSGGAIFIQGNNAKVTDSNFNIAKAKNGGAVYINGTSSVVLNSNFTISNALLAHGGAIFVEGSDANISGSKFNTCIAAKNGGAIFVDGVNTIIEKSTFVQCLATNVTVNGSGGAVYIEGNNARILDNHVTRSTAVYGACIFVDGQNTLIDNLTTESTGAIKSGGAIYIGTGGSSGFNTTIKNSNIQLCRAADSGGAIYISGNSAEISNTNITSATTNQSGGAIYIAGNNAVIKDTKLEKNSANVSTTDGRGGSIYIKGNNAKITNSNITASNSRLGGGALYIDGKNTLIDGLKVVGSYSIEDNGGAICIGTGSGESGKNTTVLNSKFTYTHAQNYGGAIYIRGTQANISGSTFESTYSVNSGGAIYIQGTYASVSNSNFTTCYITNTGASSNGGAVYINGQNANISSSSFSSCSSYKYGGAIYVIGANSYINGNFTGCRASARNSASDKDTAGGAVYISGNNAIVYGSSFDRNIAYYGGALYSSGTTSKVYYSNFTNNVKSYDGGAIYWLGGDPNDLILGCRFENNTITRYGGAIYWTQKSGSVAKGTILNSTFIRNIATSKDSLGGAVYWNAASDGHVEGCYFAYNSAYKHAGAISVGYLGGDKNFKIFNCTFEYNNCTHGPGGAITIRTAGSNITSCIFNGNEASYAGAIEYKENPWKDAVLDNCSFTNCVAFRHLTVQNGVLVEVQLVYLQKMHGMESILERI